MADVTNDPLPPAHPSSNHAYSPYAPVFFDSTDNDHAANMEEVMRATVHASNLSIQDMYELRKKLYDNKELFYKLAASAQGTSDDDSSRASSSLLPPEDLAFYRTLEKTLQEGVRVLQQNIRVFNALKDDVDQLEENKSAMQEDIRVIRMATQRLHRLSVAAPALEEGAAPTQPPAPASGLPPTWLEPYQHTLEALDAALLKKHCEQNVVCERIRQLSQAYRIIKDVALFYTCPVCLERDVSRFLMPCGHTLCEACSAKLRQSCFICRRICDRVGTLYFC